MTPRFSNLTFGRSYDASSAFAGMTTWAVALALLLAGLSAGRIKTEHAEVELIAEKMALVVARRTIGLSIKHAPHWHTYWKIRATPAIRPRLRGKFRPVMVCGDFDWPPKRPATGRSSTSVTKAKWCCRRR